MSKRLSTAWKTIGAAAFLLAASSASAMTITNVVARQNWPWSTAVTIEYAVLDASADTPMDIAVTAKEGNAAPYAVPLGAISGKAFGIRKDGTYSLTIDPSKVPSLAGRTTSGRLRFTLAPATVSTEAGATGEVLYRICDLATSNITDVTRGDLLNGAYGTYSTSLDWIQNSWVKTNSTLSPNPIVWTGVTNNPYYSTDALVLRKIPAGQYTIYGSHVFFLTNEYWLGVFPITQAQATKILEGSGRSGYSGLPVQRERRPMHGALSYFELREATNSTCGRVASYTSPYGWPTNKETVSDWSFVGRLRKMFSSYGYMFDLPTRAEWEYACLAGTLESMWNDGSPYTGGIVDTNLNNLGRYKCNGGFLSSNKLDEAGNPTDELIYYQGNVYSLGPEHGTAIVGSYRPNAWGLYDMHGNTMETPLDFYTTSLPLVSTNYPGPLTGDSLGSVCRKGGGWARDVDVNKVTTTYNIDRSGVAEGIRIAIRSQGNN